MTSCHESTVPSPVGGMRLGWLGILWLIAVTSFACYGFFGPGESDLQYDEGYRGALMYGALGFGTATCAAVGLFLVSRVRSGRLGKGWAILILVTTYIGSIFASPWSMSFADTALFRGRIFHGESGILIYAVAYQMFWLGGSEFLLLAICLLCTPKRRDGERTMKTHVEFRSNKFPPYEGEEEQINPGLWGKRLAEYLVSKLAENGIKTGEIVAEDWGWYIAVDNKDFSLAIGCGHQYGEDDVFLCFTDPATPIIRRFFRKIDATPQLTRITEALRQILSSDPEIREIEWREP